MPRRLESFPALLREGNLASSYAYGGQLTMTASGQALAMIAAGRRSVQVSGAITDHPRRFNQLMSRLLQSPRARAELRQLLDSYEKDPTP